MGGSSPTDTHLHRIGPDYEQLPINAPHVPVHSYDKDGRMTVQHAGDQPVYAPNSFGGPEADPGRGADLTWSVEAGEIGRYAYEKHSQDDDFGQAGTLYRDVMSDTDRDHLVTNIVGHASDAVTPDMQERVVAYWSKVDGSLGSRVADGLGLALPVRESSGPSGRTAAEDLVSARADRA